MAGWHCGTMAGWQWYDGRVVHGRMAPWYDGSGRMAIEINRTLLPSYHCHPAIQRELGIGYLSLFIIKFGFLGLRFAAFQIFIKVGPETSKRQK